MWMKFDLPEDIQGPLGRISDESKLLNSIEDLRLLAILRLWIVQALGASFGVLFVSAAGHDCNPNFRKLIEDVRKEDLFHMDQDTYWVLAT